MITQIEFTINRTDLIEALNFFSPFIVLKKKEDYEDEEEIELKIPEPYFEDKVTFLLHKTHANLSVLAKERVRIERTCDVDSNVENVSFCISHVYLLQEITTIQHEADRYTFKEEEIHTVKVLFTLVDDSLLYINDEGESPFGDVVRSLCTAKLQDEDMKLLEQGDNSLNAHETYKQKYLINHDIDDDSSFSDYASTEEMKAEAIRRMKEVIAYTDIIDYFEETGLPQIYEPPYGASYSLEDDELENIRKIESSHHVLVWGVIRCIMLYNSQEVAVDCMLHVSRHKEEWNQEREDAPEEYKKKQSL